MSKNQLILEVCQELLNAGDYYGEGVYPVDYDLVDKLLEHLNKITSNNGLEIIDKTD